MTIAALLRKGTEGLKKYYKNKLLNLNKST